MKHQDIQPGDAGTFETLVPISGNPFSIMGGKPFIRDVDLASHAGIDLTSIRRLMKDNAAELGDVLKGGLEIHSIPARRGRPPVVRLLNRRQVLLLITWMKNSDEAKLMKTKIVDCLLAAIDYIQDLESSLSEAGILKIEGAQIELAMADSKSDASVCGRGLARHKLRYPKLAARADEIAAALQLCLGLVDRNEAPRIEAS